VIPNGRYITIRIDGRRRIKTRIQIAGFDELRRSPASGVHARASLTNTSSTTEVTGGAAHHIGVVALPIHGVAGIVSAFVLIIAIDSGAEHRVLAHAGTADTGKIPKVASRPIRDVGVVTAAIQGVAGVGGARVLIIAVDAGTQHRVLTNASTTNSRKTAKIACHSIGHICVATLTIQGVAGVDGALIGIAAVDAGTQHAAASPTASASHPRRSARASHSARAACTTSISPTVAVRSIATRRDQQRERNQSKLLHRSPTVFTVDNRDARVIRNCSRCARRSSGIWPLASLY
jgi:hypothetical protein